MSHLPLTSLTSTHAGDQAAPPRPDREARPGTELLDPELALPELVGPDDVPDEQVMATLAPDAAAVP